MAKKTGRPRREVWEYRCAYRHWNGEVEGFLGFTTAGTKDDARLDAISQIKRKLKNTNEIRVANGNCAVEYDVTNLITRFDGLSPEENESIKRDWKTNVRY